MLSKYGTIKTSKDDSISCRCRNLYEHRVCLHFGLGLLFPIFRLPYPIWIHANFVVDCKKNMRSMQLESYSLLDSHLYNVPFSAIPILLMKSYNCLLCAIYQNGHQFGEWDREREIDPNQRVLSAYCFWIEARHSIGSWLTVEIKCVCRQKITRTAIVFACGCCCDSETLYKQPACFTDNIISCRTFNTQVVRCDVKTCALVKSA